MTNGLCVDHIHLNQGEQTFIVNHESCRICKSLGYDSENPPPASNFDYDGGG